MMKYEEYYKRAILEKPDDDDLMFNEKLRFRKIAKHIPPGTLILDAGSGTGDLQKYTNFDPQRFAGIDLNFSKLKQANYRFKVVASCEDLPFREKTFSTIVASEVVEHISNLCNL